MRILGYFFIAVGVAFLGLAVFLLAQAGFNIGFFGALSTGFVGIASGCNLILQSKGLMD